MMNNQLFHPIANFSYQHLRTIQWMKNNLLLHSITNPSGRASAHNLVDDEPVDPSHHNLQKEGEPVQTLIRRIMGDIEAADRYAKYVNRKSREGVR